MSQTITIVGNVAAGKSTLMPILTKALDARAVDADNLFQEKDPFAKPFLADMHRWAFANELWLTLERAKIMRDVMLHNNHPITLVDSGLLMSWVYMHSHLLVGNITEEEWQLYKSMYDELTHDMFHDTYVIRLKYTMDTLMERLKKRGRDYELAFYTREYLGQIEMGLLSLEERLRDRHIPIITIDEENIANFEFNPLEAQRAIDVVRSAVIPTTVLHT